MIIGVKVLLRIQVGFAISEGRPLFKNDKWNLISIYTEPDELLVDKAAEDVLKGMMNCENVISLQFHDITRVKYFKTYSMYNRVLFDEDHAKKIIDFVDSVHAKPEQEYLVVHCDAGISRSSAVACYINDYLGLDQEKFKYSNIGINPNHHVWNTLRSVKDIKIDEKDSVYSYFHFKSSYQY